MLELRSSCPAACVAKLPLLPGTLATLARVWGFWAGAWGCCEFGVSALSSSGSFRVVDAGFRFCALIMHDYARVARQAPTQQKARKGLLHGSTLRLKIPAMQWRLKTWGPKYTRSSNSSTTWPNHHSNAHAPNYPDHHRRHRHRDRHRHRRHRHRHGHHHCHQRQHHHSPSPSS